jgi:hypothetical protein
VRSGLATTEDTAVELRRIHLSQNLRLVETRRGIGTNTMIAKGIGGDLRRMVMMILHRREDAGMRTTMMSHHAGRTT